MKTITEILQGIIVLWYSGTMFVLGFFSGKIRGFRHSSESDPYLQWFYNNGNPNHAIALLVVFVLISGWLTGYYYHFKKLN